MSPTEFWFLEEKPTNPISGSPEAAQLRIDSGGAVLVTIYAPFWGNSPETMAAQIVAESLGVDPERVIVRYGESATGLISKGPAGSRFTVMLAGALRGASQLLLEKIKRTGGVLMNVAPDEIAVEDGRVFPKGAPEAGMTLGELAMRVNTRRLEFPSTDDFASGLVAQYHYDHPLATLPSRDGSDLGIFYPFVAHACHVTAVEVDEQTGVVSFLKYVAVHDSGTVVNPATLDGQIRGGTVQGIGVTLFEELQYDIDGQFLTGSFAEYLMPSALEAPDIVTGHVETSSPYTEFGIKGGGESGKLAAAPAIVAAIEDALVDFDIKIFRLPVTPPRLHEMIKSARAERRRCGGLTMEKANG